MIDEQQKKYKDYQKEYRENMADDKTKDIKTIKNIIKKV